MRDLWGGEADPWVEAGDPYGQRPVWLRPFWPGTKRVFGVEPRIAAWIWAHKDEGDIVTLAELVAAIPDHESLVEGDLTKPNGDVQFQRRWRRLRDFGWTIHAADSSPGLAPDEYRIVEMGQQLWRHKREDRNPRVPPRLARAVWARDGYRCVHCGYAGGESRDDGSIVKLRAGHRAAGSRGNKPTEDNLWTECDRCNDQVRDEVFDPVTLEELWPQIRRQPRKSKDRLLQWLRAGKRTRDDVERLYDQARFLSHGERATLIQWLSEGRG